MNAAVVFPLVTVLAFAAAMMPFAAYEAHGFFIAFLLLAAVSAQAVLEYGRRVRPDLFLAAALGFWALALLSAVLSEAPYVSFIYFCFFSVMPLSFLLAVTMQGGAFYKITAILTGAVLAALAVFTWVAYFALPGWLYKGAAHWPLADPNSFAALFSLAFFAALGLMLRGKTRAQSNAGLGLALLFVSMIFMAGSRGALLCLAAAAAVFAVFARAHVAKHKKCCGILVIGGAAIFAGLSYFAPAGVHGPSATFSGHADLAQRLALLQSTWHIARDHFWTGTGIGTFFLYYPAYRGADFSSAGFMAHCDPLQYFSEMGVLAPVLFYAAALGAVVRTIKALRNLSLTDEARIYILAPFCASGAMVAHAHINFPFNILPVLMLAGLMTGAWYARTGAAELPQAGKARAVAGYAIVLAAFVFAALQGSEIMTDRAKDRLAAGDIRGFADDINYAGQLSANKNARALSLAATIPIGVLETAQDKITEDEKISMRQRAQDLLLQAQTLNPRLSGPYYYRARLAAVDGDMTGAEAILRQGLAINPMHSQSREMLADLLVRQGKGPEALEVLKAGINWPGVGASYFQKTSALAKAAGDKELEDTALAKMLVLQGREMRGLAAGGAGDIILPRPLD